jgi:phosphopantetheine--protein transferase-like protein
MTPTDGSWRVEGRTVHWRVGWSGSPERTAARALARQWTQQLVREHELFPWAGIDPAPPGVKPRFTGAPNADFSMSYSGAAVMVAVASGAGVGVGVDIEAAPFRALHSDALLRRMCSEREAASARAMPHPERIAHLAQLWTAKEAAVKASGAGLSHDFRTFEFDLPPHTPDLSAVAHVALTGARGTAVSRVEVLPDVVRTLDAPAAYPTAVIARQLLLEETR